MPSELASEAPIHRSNRMKTLIRGPFVAVALIALGACTNLGSVQKFAKLSANAASYTDLAKDYPESSFRMATYARPQDAAQLAAEEEVREEQIQALLAMHKVLLEYMANLGKLASDDTASFERPAASLAGGLQQNQLIDAKQAAAAKSIVSLLGRAIVDGYRRAKLASLIEDSNGDLQVVVTCLREFSGTDYVAALKNEQATIDKSYRDVLENPAAEATPAAVLVLRETRAAKLADLRKREKAAVLYAEILRKIGEAHQKLYEERDRISSEQVLVDLSSYSGQLDTALKELAAIKIP